MPRGPAAVVGGFINTYASGGSVNDSLQRGAFEGAVGRTVGVLTGDIGAGLSKGLGPWPAEPGA